MYTEVWSNATNERFGERETNKIPETSGHFEMFGELSSFIFLHLSWFLV